MKLTLFTLLLALSLHSRLLAQREINSAPSADYDCMFSTVEQQFNKGRLKGDFRLQDTLVFEVRRSVQSTKQGWTIGYQIQKTYDIGLFRREKPALAFEYPVDKKGGLKAGYSAPVKLNKTDSRLFNYLRFTLLPFPPGDLKEGVSWEANVNAIPLVFTTNQGLKEKLGRQCYRVSFEQKGLRGRIGNHYFLEGEMFLEQGTGLLVWLDLKNGVSPAYSQNRYRIQMALRDSAGLIAPYLKELAAVEAAISTLKNNYEWIVPPVYNKVEDWGRRGFIVQQQGYYGWLAEDGRTILPPEYDLVQNGAGQMMQVAKNGNLALTDSSSRVLIDSLDENTSGWSVQHAAQAVKRKGRHLIINDQGRILNNYPRPLYSDFSPVGGGRWWVVSNGKSGLIDSARVIIPVEYPFFRHLGRYFSAWKDSVAYLFDADGKAVFQRTGGAVTYLSGNFIVIDGEGLFDWKTQRRVWSPCSSISTIYNQCLLCEDETSTLRYLLDTLGRPLGAFSHLDFYSGDFFTRSPAYYISKQGGLMIASEPSSGKYGLIDAGGKWVVTPSYKRIYSFDVDVFIAEGPHEYFDNPDLGMFRISGDTVLPFGHKKIWRLSPNRYYIEHPSRTGIFDLNTAAFTPVPPGITCIETRASETEYLLVVTNGKKTGLLDSDLKTVVGIEFDKIGSITTYGVVVSVNGKMGVLKR